jgi:serine kinase of HPr protein (carbohydrate metabolism regulator)
LVAAVNRTALEDVPRFAIHSGGVARDGRTIGIPAGSGHGKTTLTAALVQKGFDYLSDEALIFEDNGSVLPYPKPLALSRWSAGLLEVPVRGEETLAVASDLGGEVGAGGKLTDLILSEYGHDEATLEALPKSQAVAALIEYSFNHYKDPARAFRIATEAARDLNVWRLEYDDPLQAAELISNTLR